MVQLPAYLERVLDNGHSYYDPHESPAHVFRLRRRVGTERDFDAFA